MACVYFDEKERYTMVLCSALLSSAETFWSLVFAQLAKFCMETDAKVREFDGELLIRANQGHTMKARCVIAPGVTWCDAHGMEIVWLGTLEDLKSQKRRFSDVFALWISVFFLWGGSWMQVVEDDLLLEVITDPTTVSFSLWETFLLTPNLDTWGKVLKSTHCISLWLQAGSFIAARSRTAFMEPIWSTGHLSRDKACLKHSPQIEFRWNQNMSAAISQDFSPTNEAFSKHLFEANN